MLLDVLMVDFNPSSPLSIDLSFKVGLGPVNEDQAYCLEGPPKKLEIIGAIRNLDSNKTPSSYWFSMLLMLNYF